MGAAGGSVMHDQPNGVKLTNGEGTDHSTEYERILKVREEVFAGKHPRLKVPPIQLNAEETSKKVVNHALPSAMPSAQLPNGVHHSLPLPHPAPAAPPSRPSTKFQATHTKPTESKDSRPPIPNSSSSTQRPLNTMSRPASGSGPAAINPIFLTKSEVLVKAELQQKRQRVERALEEQYNQTNVVARMKTFQQDAVPDFDVTEVWRKAQEIVKPFKTVESNAANRTASSSDSFDDNTFYSSQMNESTTEETEEATKPRSNKACKYFVDGHCRFGDGCTFSHHVAVKPNVTADISQPINVDGVNADEQANLKPRGSLHQDDSNNQSQLIRIAELEEQIRILKSRPVENGPEKVTNGNPSQQHRRMPEEQPYSPPDVGDLPVSQHAGRDEISDRGRGQRKESVEPRVSGNVQPPPREYGRQQQRSQSPLNEVRVIRNHITSPVAPQPARVSPLAVTKVSQIPQGLEALQDSDRPSHLSGREVGTARQSPHVFLQPASSRKRRREADSYDKTRHVLARREVVSPEVHIKAEPISPPLHSAPVEILQPRRRPTISRPVYIESDSPRHGDRQTIVYQPNSIERIPQAYSLDERRPLTPVARRIISRNGHRFDVHEEQDLRRVVSARQLRAPRSPPEHYAVPQPSSARATSHVYIPQSGQVLGRQAGIPVQPLSISHADRDRSFSPQPRSNLSPTGLRPVAMAPPRRYVVDQYGQKYYEAPSMPDRQSSVIPLGRANELVSRYEPHSARSTGIRDPSAMEVYDERQYRRRAASPLSPRYIEYQPDSKPRRLYEGETGQTYGGEVYVPRTNEIRMIDQLEPRPLEQFDEGGRARETYPRTQSVRPAGGPFDSHERIARVQSVRPEQERIIDAERRSEITPYRSRQVSVRDDDTFARPSRGGFERPKYQYTPEVQERRYVEEFRNEDVLFEAPPSLGRRPVERL